MHGRDHILFGLGTLSAGTAVAHLAGFTTGITPLAAVAAVTAVVIGAIGPDIDHPHALLSNSIPKQLWRNFAPPLIGLLLLAGFGYWATGGDPSAVLLLRSDLFLLLVGAVATAVGLHLLSRFASAFGHRGFTHTLLVALPITSGTTAILSWKSPAWWWIGLFLGWGWLSHLVADALTPSGIPLWWPISHRPWHMVPYAWRGRKSVTMALVWSIVAIFILLFLWPLG